MPSAEKLSEAGDGRAGFELRSTTQVLQCRGASEAEDEEWMSRIRLQLCAVQQQVEEKRWAYLRLNVYHVTRSGLVRAFNAVSETVRGGGVFHAGLELYGHEFSFGGVAPKDEGDFTGLFDCEPRKCNRMRFYKTLPLGVCKVSKPDASKILKRFQAEWRADDYDFVRNNCVTFCRRLKDALMDDACNGDIPEWVDSLARKTSRLCLPHQCEPAMPHPPTLCTPLNSA
jgi:hypothetical protein